MDDILGFFKTKYEHLIHVYMVLETLKHHSLYPMASKCQFGTISVAFLSHGNSERGFKAWLWTLLRLRQLATGFAQRLARTFRGRFTGLAIYYRRLIRQFS